MPLTYRLSSKQLKIEQKRTKATPRRRYGPLAQGLFLTVDLLYGRKRTLAKFRVLELIARMPYQAWENVAYIAITHVHADAAFARRIHDWVEESRDQQDNEQWHMLILSEYMDKKGVKENFIWHSIFPQIMAFVNYHISWILYIIKPSLSYGLNADFEDHAEHEYMAFVEENPDFDDEPFNSMFAKDYGEFDSFADALRQIGFDERMHKNESLSRSGRARFH